MKTDMKRRGSSTSSNASKTYLPLNASQRGYSSVAARTSVNKDESSSSDDDDYRDNRLSSVAENMPMVYAGSSQPVIPTMFQLKTSNT